MPELHHGLRAANRAAHICTELHGAELKAAQSYIELDRAVSQSRTALKAASYL